MAIERRALFALAVAYTASIVAYPNLPPSTIAGPFVVLLLPVTATAIWWIFASLGRHTPQTALRSTNAGATTALFLSAFHVTMLVAFIGGQPWLARILGVMVGGFLIATGNDLPRVRPNPVWGIRTRQTLRSDDAWRRVHRVAGFIRVTMGVALSVAALSGLRGFEQLIVAAVCVEVVAGVAAGLLFSRRNSRFIAA